MKKRFLLPLLLFFLPATIISTAYAGFVYSNKVDTKTDSNSGKIDDVKPNFKLDENNYTIYFFPSMQAAQISFAFAGESEIIEKIDNAEIKENDKTNILGNITAPAWGYWNDADSAEIIGNAKGINKKYYPKKIETHGGPSISLEQFNKIGKPSTNGKDDKKFPLDFCGWTAVKQSSIDGYKSQGNFSYFSAFDDLTKADEVDNDGTSINDKKIFLYPIFTTGKNYGNPKNSVRIKSNSTSYYLSQENDDYYFNNLVIESGQKWDLCFAGTNHLGEWYGSWPSYKNSVTPLFNAENANSIIKDAGIYNVYVYLQRKSGANDFSISDARNSKFYKEITGDKLPLIYVDDLDAINSANLTNNYRIEQSVAWVSRYFWMFVKVEKVYEFRLAGTEGRGFTFDAAGQLYVSHFSSSNDASLGGLWKMYYLDNVFMEKGKNHLFTEYTNSDGKKYKIRNTVFSFLPSDESLSTIAGIEAMKDEELRYVNTNEPDLNVKGNYKGISETSFKKINNNPSEYIKNPEYLPNYNPESAYADYFFSSEFKYSGFCKVLIKVDFATSGDHKGKPTSIRVAVAPYLTNVHKVYVYPDGTDLVSFIDPDTKLIDPENNTTLKAIELTSFEMKANDDYVLNDQEMTLKDGSKMMLSAYLTQYDVVDHLTNKKIEIGKSYKRHMACWQRVKTS